MKIQTLHFAFLLLGMIISCKKKSVVVSPPTPSKTTCIDTVNISYSKQIQPILNANCVRCHDAATGQNFTSYKTTKPFAEAGILEGCITGKPDYLLMPPADKMDSCNIKAIQVWIRQGMKDN